MTLFRSALALASRPAVNLSWTCFTSELRDPFSPSASASRGQTNSPNTPFCLQRSGPQQQLRHWMDASHSFVSYISNLVSHINTHARTHIASSIAEDWKNVSNLMPCYIYYTGIHVYVCHQHIEPMRSQCWLHAVILLEGLRCLEWGCNKRFKSNLSHSFTRFPPKNGTNIITRPVFYVF